MRVPACLRCSGGPPHPMCEKQNQPFQLSFNASLKVDFQGVLTLRPHRPRGPVDLVAQGSAKTPASYDRTAWIGELAASDSVLHTPEKTKAARSETERSLRTCAHPSISEAGISGGISVRTRTGRSLQGRRVRHWDGAGFAAWVAHHVGFLVSAVASQWLRDTANGRGLRDRIRDWRSR